MDSSGRMYADAAFAEKLEEVSPSRIRPLEKLPPGRSIEIADARIAQLLGAMNFRARMVFFGARKKGDPESVALAKAQTAAQQRGR